MDVHISIIEDFKKNCPGVRVTNWCLSGHANILNRNQDYPAHINSLTWKNINPEMIVAFRTKYDDFLSTFDFFIVGYASCFAMIYKPYKKPVVMMNAVRYDVPFCWTGDKQMLETHHLCLHQLHRAGLLWIVSNNKADQLYLQLGSGLSSQFIPSLCLYAGIRYAPTQDTFLVYSGETPTHPLITQKRKERFEWSELGTFRGIIHIPYEVSTMSMFEHFSAGLPLFVPSKAFWKSNPAIQSTSAYWGDRLPEQFSTLRTPEAWIDLSDVYITFASPNTHFFDSFEHLFHLLETFAYVDTRASLANYVKTVEDKWAAIIQDVQNRCNHGRVWTRRIVSV